MDSGSAAGSRSDCQSVVIWMDRTARPKPARNVAVWNFPAILARSWSPSASVRSRLSVMAEALFARGRTCPWVRVQADGMGGRGEQQADSVHLAPTPPV